MDRFLKAVLTLSLVSLTISSTQPPTEVPTNISPTYNAPGQPQGSETTVGQPAHGPEATEGQRPQGTQATEPVIEVNTEEQEHLNHHQEQQKQQLLMHQQMLEQQRSCGTSCCGFPGMPGIPGTPGHNGIPGHPGIKGDTGMKGDSGNWGQQGISGRRGSKGPKGERGPKGSPGTKGEKGDLGKFKGDPGERGLPGEPGMKGLRGPRGPPGLQAPANHELPPDLRVAFTVINATRFATPNTPLIFQAILSNNGQGYDQDTGKFTCKVAGLYAFTFQFFGGYHNFRAEKASLVKNSEIALTAMSTVDSRLGNFAILDLVEDDDVWVEITESRDFGPSNYNSFSGFRLF